MRPSIRVAQTGIVDGGVCGSTLIDRYDFVVYCMREDQLTDTYYLRSAFKRFIKNLMGNTIFNALSNTDKNALADEFITKKEWFDDAAHQDTVSIRLPADVSCPGQKGGFLMIDRLVLGLSIVSAHPN